MHPASTLRQPRLLRTATLLVAVALAVVLPACGDDGDEAAGPAPATGPGGTDVTAVDTTAGPGDVVAACGDGSGPCVPDGPSAEPTVPPSGDETSTAGAGGDVLVDTVTTPTSGPWRALGLVRPAGSGPAELVVVATLVGSDGRVLATVEAPALVPSAPSGEAVPFELASDTASEQVADVRWTVRAEGRSPVPALSPQVFWTRAYDEARPIALPGYTEQPGGPYPFVLYGAVTATGGEPVANPGAVAAWQGSDGRIIAVAQGAALVPGTDEPAGSLAPGAAADVVLVVDDAVAGPLLAEATPILWGVSR